MKSDPVAGADARSALMDGIRQLPLDRHFIRANLKAAEPLAASDAEWRGPLAWYHPEGSGADALLAECVDATGIEHAVTVYLFTQFGEATVESSCSCMVRLCHHAAALLMRLQRLIDWPRPMTPLQRWQRTLDHYSDPTRRPAASQSPEPRQFACWVFPSGSRDPCTLVASLVVALRDQTEPKQTQWVPLESSPTGSLLSPQILLWQARLARGPRNARLMEGAHELRGTEGAALLAEWLEAGLCYHGETLQRLRKGSPRPPQWEWTLDEQARTRLQLHLSEDASVRAVELDGWLYLDEVSGELGELIVSRAAAAMIQHMPPIPPDNTDVRTNWPPHRLLTDIPPPPPPPALRVLRRPLERILVIGASRRVEHGDWVFFATAWADYGGCRLPLACNPWQDSVVRRVGGVLTRVCREMEQEALGRRGLSSGELVPLRRIVPDAWRTLSPTPDGEALAHREHHRGGAETFAAFEAIARGLHGGQFEIEYDPQLPFTVLAEETPLHATLTPAEPAGWTQFQLTAVDEGGDIDVLQIVLQGLKRRAFSLTPAPNEQPDARWLAPLGPDRFLPLGLARLREWLTPLIAYLGRVPANPSKRLELPDGQAMGLSECLHRQEVAVDGPAAARIAATLAALRAAQKSLYPLPKTFQGTLRPYQCEGLQWLQALRAAALGGVLADDMGLGKTIQVIAHLLVESEAGRLDRPALIVASTSLVFNWLDEFARFAPSLLCVNFTGVERREVRQMLPCAQIIVVSYALLNSELSALQAINYSTIVLDEAQWVKNPFTLTARAIRALRAPHKLAVTGTPLENHLGELWAHMDVVMPGYLGDYRSFNRGFRTPIERHQDDRRMAVLRQLVAPFILRRTKAEVAPELPPKTQVVLRVSMAEDQRALYESLRLSLSQDVRDALQEYDEGQSRIVVLSALMRLRQVCCDPRLLEKSGASVPRSAKLDVLLGLIRSLRDEGRQVLVFSQFTSMLGLIAQALKENRFEHQVLTGETTDRRTPVQQFQTGEVPILLASLKAGGVGLNLTAADAVIQYDPWWNPAVERQAADRAHRLGREDPVFVYQLLCEDTIEDKIASMKDRKSDLAEAVLGLDRTPAGRLTELDIRSLFDLPSLE